MSRAATRRPRRTSPGLTAAEVCREIPDADRRVPRRYCGRSGWHYLAHPVAQSLCRRGSVARCRMRCAQVWSRRFRQSAGFARAQPISSGRDPIGRPCIRPDELDRNVIRDPLRPMHHRCSLAGNDASPSRPQPCPLRPLRQRRRCIASEVNVGIQSTETRTQLVLVCDGALAQGLATEEGIVHARTVVRRSDACRGNRDPPPPDVDETRIVGTRKKPGTFRAGPFAVTASRC